MTTRALFLGEDSCLSRLFFSNHPELGSSFFLGYALK